MREEITAIWPTNDMEFAKDVLKELAPLFETYWKETRLKDTWEFDFDVETFVLAWAARALIPVVHRVDGKIKSFMLLEISRMPFSNRQQMLLGPTYIAPEFRVMRFRRNLYKYINDLANALGVHRVYRVTREHGIQELRSKA